MALNREAAEHASDFDAPIYNIWKQQTKSEGSSHFGNSETRWVDNLLYLYTSPFDVVIDPFAGGGSTLDVCRQRFRRCLISDRKPIEERSKEIRTHDLTAGIPKPPQWKDVKLVYLDPPYWKQAEGQYSDDPTDLANMSLEDFNKSLAGIISNGLKGCSRTIPDSLKIFLGDREPRRVRGVYARDTRVCAGFGIGREELGRAPRSIRGGQQTPIAGPIRPIRPAPHVGSPEPNGNHREPRPLPPPTSKFTAQTRSGLHRRVASDASSTPEPTTGHARPDANLPGRSR